MSITADQIPGYKVGTWNIDPAHTEIGFSVRHLAISKVKGVFEQFSGTIVTAEDPLQSTATGTVEVASVNTKQADRDAHLRTGDFFLAEEHPQFTFVTTGVRENGSDFLVDGELTLRGVTKPVTFNLEFGGFGGDAYGNEKLGVSATTVINRNDFGISWNGALDKGGFILGDDVTITLELQANLAAE